MGTWSGLWVHGVAVRHGYVVGRGRYSSVVERALRKRTVVGSIPTGGCSFAPSSFDNSEQRDDASDP